MGTICIDQGCTNCDACAGVCPVNAIGGQAAGHVIDQDICTDIGA